jgi:hypothetical protein
VGQLPINPQSMNFFSAVTGASVSLFILFILRGPSCMIINAWMTLASFRRRRLAAVS